MPLKRIGTTIYPSTRFESLMVFPSINGSDTDTKGSRQSLVISWSYRQAENTAVMSIVIDMGQEPGTPTSPRPCPNTLVM